MINKKELIEKIQKGNFDAVVFMGAKNISNDSEQENVETSTFISGNAFLTFELAQYLATDVKKEFCKQIQDDEDLPDVVKEIIINSVNNAKEVENGKEVDQSLDDSLNAAIDKKFTEMMDTMNRGGSNDQ